MLAIFYAFGGRAEDALAEEGLADDGASDVAGGGDAE
jgi:hypothetical protein